MSTIAPARRRRRAKPDQTPLEAALRGAIAGAIRAGQTRYAIAKAAGITQSVLDRFFEQGRSLSLRTAGKLFDSLGLQPPEISSGSE